MALTPLAGGADAQVPAPAPAYAPSGTVSMSNYPPGGYNQGVVMPAYGQPAYGQPSFGQPYPQPGYAGYPDPQPGPGPASGGYGAGPIQIPSGSTFTPRLAYSGGYGDGLGWQDGYSSIGAWIPLGFSDDNGLFYVDARGFLAHNQGGGGNFTAGARYYMPEIDRFFGVYGGFDIDAGNTDNQSFYRAAVGVESIGRYVTWRLNGYIPLGDQNQTIFNGVVGSPFFQGNNIVFLNRDITRFQYGGFDGEVGGPLPFLGNYGVQGFVGGYYLTSNGDRDAPGFQARVEANVNDDVQVGTKVTTDTVFDTNVWATLTIRSPRGSWADWMHRDWFTLPTVRSQMDRQAERLYRITTRLVTEDSNILAINPLDGAPIQVFHIDPTVAGGAGTVENPSPEYVRNANIDIFRVIASPGAVLDTPGPIVLDDNQRLLSSAVQHRFDSQFGVGANGFALPGFTGGALPTLMNTAPGSSSVVVLANNNEVSGFRIDGTSPTAGTFHTGITSQAGGISSFNINRNNFLNVANGTQVDVNRPGFSIFDLNNVTGTGVGSFRGLGVNVSSTAGPANVLVSRNTISGFVGEDTNRNGVLDPGEDRNGDGLLTAGVSINLNVAGSSLLNADIRNNTVQANGEGVRIAAAAGSTVNAGFMNNTVRNNTQNNGVMITGNAATLNASFFNDTITNNVGNQVDVLAANGTTARVTVDNSSFDRISEGATGLRLRNTTGSTTTARVTNSTFVGRGAVPGTVSGVVGGPGIYATVPSGNLNLTVGGATAAAGNTINANAGAGVAVATSGSGIAQLDVRNNIISATADDATVLTPFSGQGIDLRAAGGSTITNSVIDMNVIGVAGAAGGVAGNADDGIAVTASENATVSNLLIGNTDGDNGNGNVIAGNGTFVQVDTDGDPTTPTIPVPVAGHGINVTRLGGATVDNLRIIDNTVSTNALNGVNITAGGGLNDMLDVLVADNTLTTNAQDGLTFNVTGDGVIDADVTNNFIANNGSYTGLDGNGNPVTINTQGNGIGTTQDRFAIDTGFVGGTWTDNIITGNTGNGIQLIAPGDALNELFIGTQGAGNQITLNGLAGIEILGPVFTTVTDNTIAQNGQGNPTGFDGAGVNIDGVGRQIGRFVGNRIVDNFGDGVEITNVSQFMQYEFTDNIVARNSGRGYDVLNSVNGTLDLTIRGTAPGRSIASGNGEEGVYIINAADGTILQNVQTPIYDPNTDPSHGLGRAGSVLPRPNMTLNFTGNLVQNNGTTAVGPGGTIGIQPGKGLVIRVGTSDGGFGPTFPGGFAGDGFGGIIANVTNNLLSGNIGADVYVDSFTSTVTPGTGTTFNATTYNPAGYQSDPLARLDLNFVNNTFESTNFTTIGAFYNDNDPEFKSRVNTQTPAGPFTSGTRRRNAQRLAFRDGLPPFGPPDNQTLQYPGLGESTFRITQQTLAGTNTIINPDGTTTTVGANGLFILDNQPYTFLGDANGVFFTNGLTFGEFPYGYSVVP